ncbi:hypothetical protein COU37_03540 [Candidatus Micrarchaeota archaeon CG10_big_fil_rev_8_21_14_0_10_45_29]|nr:MAG: hypothetical protein COU37_03540 [Candidatus Micrarchaeota archaeon CG10_big_fil_rev_8_21_14_0_10_45_29]
MGKTVQKESKITVEKGKKGNYFTRNSLILLSAEQGERAAFKALDDLNDFKTKVKLQNAIKLGKSEKNNLKNAKKYIAKKEFSELNILPPTGFATAAQIAEALGFYELSKKYSKKQEENSKKHNAAHLLSYDGLVEAVTGHSRLGKTQADELMNKL